MPILDLTPDLILSTWPESGRITLLDLEYTAWEKSLSRGWGEPWEWREIVQVGALVVEARDFTSVESYEALVKPTRNPCLSDYFKALTGISQADVELHGCEFQKLISEITPFFQRGEFTLFNGNDGQVLTENCAFHNIEPPFVRERMFNFRPLLAASLGREPSELISSALPSLAGIRLDLRAHSALADCRAIAASLAHWRSAGLV